MVAATAGFCCCRRSPALHTFESMAGRLAPTQGGGAFTAAVSAGLIKPLSGFWVANSTSASCRRGFTEEQRFAPKWVLFNVGPAATRRAYHRAGDTGRPNSMVAQVYEQYGGPQQQQQERGGFPRPPVIPWVKDCANAVQLIGRVGREIELKYLDSGKVVATTSLAVKKGSKKSEGPSWFFLEIWDDLAEIAAHHVAKGELIFVTGRIVIDKKMKDEVTYTNVKVIVRDLCFVEPDSDQRQPYGQSNEVVVMGSGSHSEAEAASMDSSQRNWNQQQVSKKQSQEMVAQKGSSGTSSDAALVTEKRWQEYFSDPTQWWDNRENKKNPKAPDFKHKSTQEALWINSWNNPPWVTQQLAVLEEKKGQHKADFRDSSGSQDKKLSSFQDSDILY